MLADRISIKQLLDLIPEKELDQLSIDTKVNYQVKTLYGKSMFYLLLYGLITCEKTSLRGLEDTFNSNRFKVLFNLDSTARTKFNSISDRLATMDLSFFEKAYDRIYEIFSKAYSEKESLAYNIVRVDSTMVAETANKLEAGMSVGCKKDGKKQAKYTICMEDLFPCSVQVFTAQSELSEDKTIPATILKIVDPDPKTVFVFDRGVSSRKAFAEIDGRDWRFVTRIKTSAKYKEIEPIALKLEEIKINNLMIQEDKIVQLYSKNKILPNKFRLTKAVNHSGSPVWFLSNLFDCNIPDIISIYKQRWQIEVFFRFIKQELNFSHFMSTNINGIKIILYMTLILSMLIQVYKKYNKIGFKTAKRRLALEIDELITMQIVIACGGNPNLLIKGP
ncbi:MAG: IS4 family transposase [Flavobacterium sp.]|nr:MAG: IS4 family transposase [Flavobacterium sp.]